MLTKFLSLSHQCFLVLRRDQIFLAGVILSVFTTLVAHTIDSWTINESYKLLYDILAFSLNFFGTMIAIFWGTNCLDTEQKSQYTLSLSAPVSRPLWLLSQYTGLLLALSGLLVLNALIWQLSLFLQGYPFMSLQQLMIFPNHFLSWLVIASTAVYFSSFCSRSTSLFCSFCLWIMGMLAPLLPSPPNSIILEFALKSVKLVWNLQVFNTVPSDHQSLKIFILTFSYGICLVACFLFASMHIYSRRDL